MVSSCLRVSTVVKMQFFPNFHPSILSIDGTLIFQFASLSELFDLTIFSAANSASSLYTVHE